MSSSTETAKNNTKEADTVESMRFTPKNDLLLLKTTRANPVCNIKHGESEEYWKKVTEAIGFQNFKTVRGRYYALLKEHKKAEGKARKSSGTEEEENERTVLLTELLELENEKDSKKSKEDQKKSAANAEAMAMLKKEATEKLNLADEDSDDIGEESEVGSSSSWKKRRRSMNYKDRLFEMESKNTKFQQELTMERSELAKKQAAIEAKKLELQKNQLEFEKEKYELEKTLRMSDQKLKEEQQKQQNDLNQLILKMLMEKK